MRNERNNLKAGLFIIISIVLIIAVVVGIKGIGHFLEPKQERRVVFDLTDDIGGLNKGDEVRVGGLKQGIVEDIGFVNNAGAQPKIVVTFSIPRRIEIKPDAHVTVQTGITGASNLNIDDLGAGGAVAKAETAPSDALKGMPSGLAKLTRAIGELAPEVQGTVHDVRQTTLPKLNKAFDNAADVGANANTLIKNVQGKVDPVVDRYNRVADAAHDAMKAVNDFLGGSGGNFQETLANLKGATGSIKDKLPGIMDQLSASLAKVQTSIDNVNSALEDIKQLAANTKDATSSARSILVTNRGKIDDMIASLKKTGDNLEAASVEIRHSPWRLLYKPEPGEIANLNLFDSTRRFAEGANDLSEASVALRDALNDPNVDKETIQKLVEKLDKSFDGFQEVEQQLWQRVKQ